MPTLAIAQARAGSDGVFRITFGIPRTLLVQYVLQVAQPRLLALDADRVVERDRVLDGEIRVHGMRARVIQLHDVGVVGHPPVAVDRPERRESCPAGHRGCRCRAGSRATCGATPRSSRTPRSGILKSKCANACAPSTSTSTPRACAMSAIFRTGRICPVMFTMCDTISSRVRGVMALRIQPHDLIVGRADPAERSRAC